MRVDFFKFFSFLGFSCRTRKGKFQKEKKRNGNEKKKRKRKFQKELKKEMETKRRVGAQYIKYINKNSNILKYCALKL